jgi:hypothetical protein
MAVAVARAEPAALVVAEERAGVVAEVAEVAIQALGPAGRQVQVVAVGAAERAARAGMAAQVATAARRALAVEAGALLPFKPEAKSRLPVPSKPSALPAGQEGRAQRERRECQVLQAVRLGSARPSVCPTAAQAATAAPAGQEVPGALARLVAPAARVAPVPAAL